MNRIMVVIPVCILTIIVITAIFANFIAPYDYAEQKLTERLRPPAFMEEGTRAHLLGTDELGRDVFSRIVYGARISLQIAILVTLINVIIGTIIGIISGYFGGRLDNFIMRVVDILLGLPSMIILLILAAAIGQGFLTLLIAFTITGWAGLTRAIRGLTLSYKNQDFVAQAYINGCSPARIMIRHIFPNLVNYIVITGSLSIPGIIMAEAIYSYIGIGFPPPTPSWGAIANGGTAYMPDHWWIAVLPCIAIALLVLSMFYVGNWVQDRMDPKLRQK